MIRGDEMPTKNAETGQLYYEVDGGFKPLGKLIELTAEMEDVSGEEYNPLFEGGEITFKIPKKEWRKFWKKIMVIMYEKGVPKHLKNNWRKMHHLPMTRRKGKRK